MQIVLVLFIYIYLYYLYKQFSLELFPSEEIAIPMKTADSVFCISSRVTVFKLTLSAQLDTTKGR